ncbi:hypothetical protein RRF57_011623 [Xylaria bambusicola]|uniref:Uncharacterized protein n=1 Tax=Xylaria bambusicola TaxID=326684 RepID=A0AAN7V0V3_9PEZI
MPLENGEWLMAGCWANASDGSAAMPACFLISATVGRRVGSLLGVVDGDDVVWYGLQRDADYFVSWASQLCSLTWIMLS